MKLSCVALVKFVSSTPCRKILVAVLLATVVAVGVASYAPLAHAASRSTVTKAAHTVSVVPDLVGCYPGVTLVITLWSNANYGGTKEQLCTTELGCTADLVIHDLGSYWDKNVSSFKTWNDCTVTVAFSKPSFAGNSKTYGPEVPYVGNLMNDNISSLELCPTFC